ncbi:MAG: Clp protease ClpP [Oscillospiraceae bacterium]|nr:Clp protease ClpP [Oscillospiraceae bacterium]
MEKNKIIFNSASGLLGGEAPDTSALVKPFWNIVASSGDNPPELILYGDISSYSWWGDSEHEITSQQFNEDLDALGDVSEIIVRINSWGGEVFEAVAIYTRLKNHKAKITVIIDGVAASAATIIAMAGDVIKIPAAAMFMIHDPMCVCYGNQAEHEKAAGMLESVKNSIIAAYALKTSKSVEDISALMTAETWYTGQEAVNAGFCDEVLFGKEIKMIAADMSILARYKNAPKALLNKFTPPVEDKPPPVSGTNQIQKGDESMEGQVDAIKTVEELKAAYPDLTKQIEDSAAKVSTEAERKRIQDIEGVAIAGFEEVVQKAKFGEEPVAAADVAMAIIAAQKQQAAAYLANVEKDIASSGMSGVAPEGHEGGGSSKPQTPNQKMAAAKADVKALLGEEKKDD